MLAMRSASAAATDRGGVRLDQGSAGMAKIKLRGRARVDTAFTLALAAYNLIRLPKLLAVPA
jgi:hypothetical protein